MDPSQKIHCWMFKFYRVSFSGRLTKTRAYGTQREIAGQSTITKFDENR